MTAAIVLDFDGFPMPVTLSPTQAEKAVKRGEIVPTTREGVFQMRPGAETMCVPDLTPNERRNIHLAQERKAKK